MGPRRPATGRGGAGRGRTWGGGTGIFGGGQLAVEGGEGVVSAVYLPPGRPCFLSAARFHGLNSFFSSGLSCPAVSDEASRSSNDGAAPSPACDDAHRIEPAAYVWRDNWARGRLRAGLDNPRRLAMTDMRGTTDGEQQAELRPKAANPTSRCPENFWVEHSTGQIW